MKSSTILVFIFLTAISFSCSPVIYSTMQPISLLPEQKGELEASFGNTIYSSAFEGNLGVTLNAAYALSDQFYISANYMNWSGTIESDTSNGSSFLDVYDWGSQGNIFELGLGRYWVHQEDSRWRYEVSGGFGLGFIDNQRVDFAMANARYQNFYVQPSAGFKSKRLWLTGSLKVNFINFQTLEWDFLDFSDNEIFAA
ncbi:MAG: hypothetical protein AAF705_19840, partial [Bacteroidota bacterium]